MTLLLTNTLGGRREPFEPLEPGRVRMYHCGPTVTEPINLHKFRSYLLADVLRRTLEYLGHRVHQVMNITDVGHLNEFEEDIVEITAGRSGKAPWELVEEEIEEFHAHRRALRILDAEEYPQARQHVDDMIAFIERLLAAGVAYRTDHNVYLDVHRYPDFGRLSGASLEELERRQEETVQTAPRDKRHPLDVDLWRTDVLHQMHWQSPWGLGFPGWHLECVVMSQKYLGPSFDIHTGSEEIIFPHHECEIAQAEVLTHEPLARYWLHSAHVLIGGQTISRKNQNLLTVKGLLDEGFEGAEIRGALIDTHYRERLELEAETLEKAQSRLQRLRDAHRTISGAADGHGHGEGEARPAGGVETIARAEADFRRALEADLDIPRALDVAIGLGEQTVARLDDHRGPLAAAARQALERFDAVLALL